MVGKKKADKTTDVSDANATTPESAAPVVVAGDKKHLHINKRWVIAGLIILGVLVVAGVGYTVITQTTEKQPTKTPLTYEQQQQKELAEATEAAKNVGEIRTPEGRAKAAKAYTRLAVAQLNVDAPDAAILAYQNALVVSDDKGALYSGLTYAYEEVGNLDEAKKSCSQYLDYLSGLLAKDKDDIWAQQQQAAFTNKCNRLAAGE